MALPNSSWTSGAHYSDSAIKDGTDAQGVVQVAPKLCSQSAGFLPANNSRKYRRQKASLIKAAKLPASFSYLVENRRNIALPHCACDNGLCPISVGAPYDTAAGRGAAG